MYLTITQRTDSTFVDSKSKFIGVLFPCNSLQAFKVELDLVKQTYPNATHYCSACIFGNPLECRSSDDGEPAGSAGNPILGQLRASKLIDISCIVVRYYGGTKLGIPGLIKSYKAACLLAIEESNVIPFIRKQSFEIRGDYEMLMRFYSKNHKKGWEMKTTTLGSEFSIQASLPMDEVKEFKNHVTLYSGLEWIQIIENF